MENGFFPGVGGDDFLAEAVGLAEVGAEEGARAFGRLRGQAQTEAHAVSDKAEQAFARRGIHDQAVHANAICRMKNEECPVK